MRFKVIIDLLKQRAFWLCLVLAFTIWFINKLGNTYISNIVIPVEFTTSYESQVWVENPKLRVRATVQAKGNVLLLYKLGLMSSVRVPLSLLEFTKDESPLNASSQYNRRIEAASMVSALGQSQTDIVVMQVMGVGLNVRVSPIATATVAIEPRIEIHCQRQYMQVGGLVLSQDSLLIKAPQIILDTLSSIKTDILELKGLSRPVQGNIDLIIPKGVVAQISDVEYSVDVTGYTELVFTVPVTPKNVPDSLRCYLVPSMVQIIANVPLRSLGHVGTMREPIAAVNYNDLSENLSSLLRVSIDSLSYGMKVKTVAPSFVEPFFQTIRK